MNDRLDETIAGIAAEHHGIFGRHHLGEFGISDEECWHRLATGRWQAVHDSVYRIAGAPLTWRAKVLAACWAGGIRAVASHRSAAALLALPSGRRDLAEITCPRWQRARHTGIVVHESRLLTPADITVVDCIPCTTVERTLFEIAGACRQRTLDLALDSALRRELTTLPALEAAAARMAKRGRRGSALFRAALAERTTGPVPDSAPERLLALALVRQGLPSPELQYVLRDLDGRFVARVDLAYPDDRIVIEYDSYQEHTGKVALVRDSARRNAVAALGYTTLTATAADLADDAAALARTLNRVRARAA